MSYGLNIGLDIIIKILNSLFWKIFAAHCSLRGSGSFLKHVCLPEWVKHGWECLVEHGAQGERLESMEPHSGQRLPDLDVYQNHQGGGLIKICSSPGPLLETIIPLVLEQRPETYIFKAPQVILKITPDLRHGSGRYPFLRRIARTKSGIFIISISWAPLLCKHPSSWFPFCRWWGIEFFHSFLCHIPEHLRAGGSLHF